MFQTLSYKNKMSKRKFRFGFFTISHLTFKVVVENVSHKQGLSMRKNSQLVENQLKSFLWTLYRFFRIISRKLDLVLKFVWFCLPKKFHPLFFGPCLSCLLGGEGRVRLNAWCERRRGVCVVHEVSM